MPTIELEGLTKTYGDVTALSGVDLTVRDGEIFGFLGPNGAGKSTTIGILLDFVRPTAGEARVFGMDVQAQSLAVREESAAGTTVFFSSHILSQVEAVCDRVGILRAGELVAVDTIEGLREAAGTRATLTVTVGSLPEGAVETVRETPGVASVSVDGSRLVVDVEDDAKTAVLSALEDAGADVADFETAESSLEELFLSYTGDGEGQDAGEEAGR
jgi:ABC-type multidrug transport system ATPase subunit